MSARHPPLLLLTPWLCPTEDDGSQALKSQTWVQVPAWSMACLFSDLWPL